MGNLMWSPHNVVISLAGQMFCWLYTLSIILLVHFLTKTLAQFCGITTNLTSIYRGITVQLSTIEDSSVELLATLWLSDWLLPFSSAPVIIHSKRATLFSTMVDFCNFLYFLKQELLLYKGDTKYEYLTSPSVCFDTTWFVLVKIRAQQKTADRPLPALLSVELISCNFAESC